MLPMKHHSMPSRRIWGKALCCLLLLILIFEPRTCTGFTQGPVSSRFSWNVHVLKDANVVETLTRPSDEKQGSNENRLRQKKKKFRNSNKRRQPAHSTRGPWLASYQTSRLTQERIQKAGAVQGWDPLRRATCVLQTLLEQTPVEYCNTANLVCALTLSAKVRSTTDGFRTPGQRTQAATEQLRHYLWKAITVLRELNAKDQLSVRQICNAAWALAKHLDRDPLLLPSHIKPTALSSEHHVGMAEEWSLGEHLDPAQVVDCTVDELAQNLSQKLRENPWSAKEGELCMVYWAYGVLRERRRPAGWKLAPQIGLAKGTGDSGQEIEKRPQTKNDGKSTVRFEQLKGGFPKSRGEAGDELLDLDPPSATDELFDQIALSLCLPVAVPNSTKEGMAPLRLQACRWNELSHIAWAHASHGWSSSSPAEDVLLAVSSEASQRLRNGNKSGARPLSRDMAQMIWSLGVLQADNFRLTSGLIQVLDGVSVYTDLDNAPTSYPFAQWSCADVVQVPLALAHARIDDQKLLRSLYAEAAKRMSVPTSTKHRNLHAWEVSILLWAQARLYLTEQQGVIFQQFPSDAVDFLNGLSKSSGGWASIGIGAQEQANLIWSLTVLEQFRSRKAVDLIRELFRVSQDECRQTGIIQLEHAHQLWQALFLLEEEAAPAVEGVEPWFRDTLESKWMQEKARPKASSARHKALSKVLVDMGVAHFNEHDEDIDVAIVLKRAATWTHETDRLSLEDGMKVAVEFDGPNHFTRILDTDGGEPPRSLGHSVLKYRLLKRQGWIVVRVPYYEFDRIPFWASMERQRYVQRLLKTHSDLRFSSADVSEYKPPVANRQSRYQ